MYRKRWIRERQKYKSENDSPRSKSQNLLRNLSTKELRENYFFIMFYWKAWQVNKTYKEAKKNQKMNYLNVWIWTFWENIGWCQNLCNCWVLESDLRDLNLTMAERHYQNGYVLKWLISTSVMITQRVMTGVKNTVTKGKIKMQRRVLLHNLKSLHQKFLMEVNDKISYSEFLQDYDPSG